MLRAMANSISMIVVISTNPDTGVMTAVCDELGMVVEADDYPSLMHEIELVAPELAELNRYPAEDYPKLELTLRQESTFIIQRPTP